MILLQNENKRLSEVLEIGYDSPRQKVAQMLITARYLKESYFMQAINLIREDAVRMRSFPGPGQMVCWDLARPEPPQPLFKLRVPSSAYITKAIEASTLTRITSA